LKRAILGDVAQTTWGVDPLDVRQGAISMRIGSATSRHYGQMKVEDCGHRSLPLVDHRWSAPATTASVGAPNSPPWNAGPRRSCKQGHCPDAGEVRHLVHAHAPQSGRCAGEHVYADGSVSLSHSGTEMGQGLNQKVAQVVAGEFGLEVGAVRITAAATDKVANGGPTAASVRFRPQRHGGARCLPPRSRCPMVTAAAERLGRGG
jgi:CO/xanthine dehydrogenase Mo-binding subunit